MCRLRPLTFLALSQPRLALGTVSAARTDWESITAAVGWRSARRRSGPARVTASWSAAGCRRRARRRSSRRRCARAGSRRAGTATRTRPGPGTRSPSRSARRGALAAGPGLLCARRAGQWLQDRPLRIGQVRRITPAGPPQPRTAGHARAPCFLDRHKSGSWRPRSASSGTATPASTSRQARRFIKHSLPKPRSGAWDVPLRRPPAARHRGTTISRGTCEAFPQTMPDGRRLQPSCFQRPAGPSTSPYGRRAVRLRVTTRAGCGRRHAGFVPAPVHPGDVWLAEAMTGHRGQVNTTGRAGEAAGAAEDHDRGSVPGLMRRCSRRRRRACSRGVPVALRDEGSSAIAFANLPPRAPTCRHAPAFCRTGRRRAAPNEIDLGVAGITGAA